MDRRRRERWLVAAAFGLLAAGALVVAVARRSPPAGERYDPRLTTMSSGLRGARAYYLLLQELGWTAERHFDAIGALPRRDSIVVAILSPVVPLRPVEVDSLLDRVERGAGLLWVSGFTGSGLLEPLGFAARWSPDSLAVRAAGPFRRRGLDDLAAAHLFFRPEPEAPDFEALLESDSGAVAITFRHGAGRVVAFADGRYFTNRSLRAGDHASLAVNAVTTYWERPLYFDEFHQGFQEGGALQRSVIAFFLGHPLGWAALQLALAGLALLVLHGRRLGAPRPPAPKWRRSEVEHVEALAGAYEAAGARRVAAERIRRGAARRLGLRARGGGESVLETVERRFGGDEVRARVRRLREWGTGELRDHDLVELARTVHDLEEEVRRRWRSTGRRSSRARR